MKNGNGVQPKIGRPAKAPADSGVRNQLGIQISSEMKRRIMDAATKNGRTMSRETEIRLEQSFLIEDMLRARLIKMRVPA